MFGPGSAEINDEMKGVLEQIAKFINASAYQVYIDGHTDSVPIKNAMYSSNEDLSLARALNIMNHFVTEEDIAKDIIAVTGYGEHRPAYPNNTAADMTNNRRVEMIFKNKRYF